MDLREKLQSTFGDAYTVERELGGGGMSRVFLAHETALGRNVVVKVLHSEMIGDISAERFAREVKLAASLQHPNIVPVLSTGVADGIPWYTMPYVKGESLRARMHELGTLPRRQVISILRDLARALQYAHEEGVVHRDIKPENILLSGDAAVVTDFGIAKAISAARTSAAAGTADPSTLTRAGSTIGTPPYMAPEQVAGDPVDRRTDIYAWGLIAYELLASNHPFAGKANISQLLAAQLTEKPQPLGEKASGIPPGLAELVMRCLEKNPDDRPASAAEVLEGLDVTLESRDHPSMTMAKKQRHRSNRAMFALIPVVIIALGLYAYFARRGGTAANPERNSVAVLPFADPQADSSQAYFGEGIADELMTALAKVPGLRVASRTSAIALGRRRDLDVKEIGRQLGVATVVEGTVRRSGNQLRVTAQLTNAADGLALWSDAYERENKDVFAVQDEITRAIVAELRPELAARGRPLPTQVAKGPGTTDPEAYDLYMRGLYLIERRGPGVALAADYFTRAVQKDPNFARAHAGLADALEFFPYFAGVSAEKVEPRVKAAAEKALRLDPTLAEPRVALAMAHWHAYRWKEAEEEFKRAIAADSTAAVAHTQYGRFLMSLGNIPAAIDEFRKARKLDPLAATSSIWLSHSLNYMGQFAAAEEESRRARELDPNTLNNRTVLVFDMVAAGKHAQALSVMGDAKFPIGFNGFAAWSLEKAGDKARAAAIRRELDAMPDSTWMVHESRVYAYLATADTAKVLSEMEEAFARGEIIAQTLPFIDRLYDPVRHTARFAEIVRKCGLEGRGLTGRYGGRPGP
jgi:serine/threonine-protein kinase